MKKIFTLNSKVAFLISLSFFGVSFLIKEFFSIRTINEYIPSFFESVANLVSNGYFYLSIGFLVYTVLKVFFEKGTENYQF
tara:strand:+ start:3059 stop:3301 length:243 start_codon:yes stop_codon:yes gene_type:complete